MQRFTTQDCIQLHYLEGQHANPNGKKDIQMNFYNYANNLER